MRKRTAIAAKRSIQLTPEERDLFKQYRGDTSNVNNGGYMSATSSTGGYMSPIARSAGKMNKKQELDRFTKQREQLFQTIEPNLQKGLVKFGIKPAQLRDIRDVNYNFIPNYKQDPNKLFSNIYNAHYGVAKHYLPKNKIDNYMNRQINKIGKRRYRKIGGKNNKGRRLLNKDVMGPFLRRKATKLIKQGKTQLNKPQFRYALKKILSTPPMKEKFDFKTGGSIKSKFKKIGRKLGKFFKRHGTKIASSAINAVEDLLSGDVKGAIDEGLDLARDITKSEADRKSTKSTTRTIQEPLEDPPDTPSNEGGYLKKRGPYLEYMI